MKRLTIAMLSAQVVQTEADVTDIVQDRTELDMVGEQAEDAMAEAAQIQTQIDQAQQAIDDTEEVLQEVEEERQALEQSQQNGGMDKPAMEALQRAFSRFEKRTGVPCAIRSLGLEAFSAKSTRAHSTSVAMENAGEYIKSIIKMLTDAMASVWEKTKAFFEKIWIGAERLAKRAEQVGAAAKNAEGKVAPADAKIKAGSVLAFTRKDDKVIEGGDFVKAYIAQTSAMSASRKGREVALADFVKGETVKKILEESKKPDNKENIVKAILDTHIAKDAKGINGLMIMESNVRLLGDYVTASAYLTTDSTWEQIEENYKKVKPYLVVSKEAKELSKEVTPLAVIDAEKIANKIAIYMNSYSDMRDEQNKIDKEVKMIVAQTKSLEKEKNAPIEQIKLATAVVRALVNNVMQSLVAYRSYDVNLSKAALDYAAASIRAANGETQKA